MNSGGGKKFLDFRCHLATVQKASAIRSFALIHPIRRRRSVVSPACFRPESQVNVPGRRVIRETENWRIRLPGKPAWIDIVDGPRVRHPAGFLQSVLLKSGLV